MKITKSTVECYKIRELKEGWANITIDDLGTSGRVQIASDFGDWQYYWSSCGCPFKEFLTRLNMDYVADKFREDEHVSIKKTINAYKSAVLECRRFDGMSKARARDIWRDITALAESWWTPESFSVEIRDKEHLLEFYNWTPETCTDVSPLFKRFWNEIWVGFIDHLKAEIIEKGSRVSLFK